MIYGVCSHDAIFLLFFLFVCVMDNSVVNSSRVVDNLMDNRCSVNYWHFNMDVMVHNWLNNVVNSGIVNNVVLGRMAFLNDGSVNKSVCCLFGLIVVDDNFVISINLFGGKGTLTVLDFVVGMRSCRISMVWHCRNLSLFNFLGTDRLVMDFLGIDMGSGVMSWIVTPGIAVVSVTISTSIAVVMVSSATVMVISAVGGTVVSMTNVPCFVVSMMVRITVILSEFNVRGLMGRLVVVSGVEAVSVAVVTVVSMGAIAVAVAIDAVVTFSTDRRTIISMSTVYTVAMISRSTISCSTISCMDAIVCSATVGTSTVVSVSTIGVCSWVVAVVSEFSLVRTGGDLSDTTTEFMVIDGPVVSHNVLNNLLRRQDFTLHI